jgi:hypothetical protein
MLSPVVALPNRSIIPGLTSVRNHVSAAMADALPKMQSVHAKMCFPLEIKSEGAWHSAGRPVEVGFSLKLPLVRTKAFSIFYIILLGFS